LQLQVGLAQAFIGDQQSGGVVWIICTYGIPPEVFFEKVFGF
jgi:hypothetical protein